MQLDKLLVEHQAWIQEELLRHLQQLLRLDSRTALARETEIARYLATELAAASIGCEVVEPVHGKGSTIAFLGREGTGRREPSLLLLSHTDTAGWDERQWQYPPLSGLFQDGHIWGRGAVDCKGLVTIWLVVLLLAARCKLWPERPIVFAAVADEEAGGKYGAGWLMEYTSFFQDVGFVLGEGGGYPVFFGGRRYLTCQTGEQGPAVAAYGSSGQLPDSYSNTDVVHDFCQRVLAGQKWPYRWLAAWPGLWPRGLSRLQAAAPVRVNLDILFHTNSSPATDCRTELFQLIAEQVAQGEEAVAVLPYVTPGISDNRFFRNSGIPAYGFFPLRDEEAIRTIHQANERIALADLVMAFNILFQVVSRFCRFTPRR